MNLDRAIEAAGRAMFDATNARRTTFDPPTWSELMAEIQLTWRESAAIGLAAALPILEPQIREKVAQELLAKQPPQHPNPRYRETVVLSCAQAAAIARGQTPDPMWQPQTPDIRPAAGL